MTEQMRQCVPYPEDLDAAVKELHYIRNWHFDLADQDRGQGCSGLTLSVYPDNPDSYHPEQHVNTVFTYPVPAAAFNRESWEEWLWQRIEETENHERAENFRFVTNGDFVNRQGEHVDEIVRRPYKPAHPDGWNPGVVRTVVSETVTNTPNAGRLVRMPCALCQHHHKGRMGEHFTIEHVYTCSDGECDCAFGK